MVTSDSCRRRILDTGFVLSRLDEGVRSCKVLHVTIVERKKTHFKMVGRKEKPFLYRKRWRLPGQSEEDEIPSYQPPKIKSPETLQYRARARITCRADNDFKTDIKRIRMNAEQEVLKALTRFHYRKIERYRVEIEKSKRPRISETPNTSTKNCTPTESAHSAPAENNDVTVEHVKQIAVNIQANANIAQFSKMMEN